MADLLITTGVAHKNTNDSLYSSEINSMNRAINNSITEINNRMKSFCNINIEELNGNFNKSLTLAEAISLIKPSRRCPGMIIKFIEDSEWVEYEYTQIKNSTEEAWVNLLNWRKCGDIENNLIDGGVF